MKLEERTPDSSGSVSHRGRSFGAAPWAAALLTTALLGVVQAKVSPPMLLAERFHPGLGWLEVALGGAYALVVTSKMLDPRLSARWRRGVWTLFSAVFFGQLALGAAGHDLFLMKPGQMHFPVPGLILAYPIYRGGHLFMPILFLVSALLLGPAWCSHICYLGAWDLAASRARKKPRPLPRWHRIVRPAMVVLTVLAALVLRLMGAGPLLAGGAALALGLAGVAVMLLWSRRTGVMTHCTVYCPMGLLATYLGKLSPFRFRIAPSCDGCMRCTLSCRYGALTKETIERRKVGPTCTLCGDCVGSCPHGALQYGFVWDRLVGDRGGLEKHEKRDRRSGWARHPLVSPTTARTVFVVLAITLHTATLLLARV